MPVYAVFEAVVDPNASADVAGNYDDYRAAVPALIERHGGRYLVRAATAESLEGEPSAGRWHVVEFPDAASARAFWESPDYLALKPLREGAADVRAVLLEPRPAPAADDDLLAAARAVQARAHVPYSQFPVGAAIRAASGNVYVGCNVENAAYPQGVCAEGGAISAMVAGGDTAIDTIVTVCEGDQLGTPCGGCRQKIREFATADTVVRCAGPEGFLRDYTIAELLPDGFGPENLSF
jgi:cytidine deaminase